jgi:hypothetical protein
MKFETVEEKIILFFDICKEQQMVKVKAVLFSKGICMKNT